MKKIIDYKTIYVFNSETLQEQIKNLIKEGWEPFGNTSSAVSSVAGGYTNTRFIQQMVKYNYDEIEETIPLLLGEKIIIWRKRRDLSQEKLAEKAGVSRNSISMLERGEYNPTIEQLQKIAGALELELIINLIDQRLKE